MQHFKKVSALILIVLIALPASSYAVGGAGFENATFSPRAYARGAVTADPDEPASISSNPAGLVDLPGVQFQGNANFLNMWTRMDSDLPGGGSSRSSGTTIVAPTTYLSVNPGKVFNDRLALGLGVDSPFGLSNKYDSGFTATHYTGSRNWLKMYAIKPVASFRFTDWLSMGGGPMWYRIFDLGQIAAYPNKAITGVPTTPDGQVRGNLSGNAWGWHMGILAKPAPKHKIGFYFRSPVLVRAKGLLKGENILDDFAGGGTTGKFETGIHTKVHLPMNMTWGYNYKATEKTDVGIDFGWTRWSVFDNLNIPVDPISGTSLGGLSGFHDNLLNSLFNTPGPTGAADKDWHNGYSLAYGVSHKMTDKLTLRGSNFWYWTPIPKNHFTPVVPDSNRMIWAAGISYAFTKYLTFDAAYTAVFFLNRHVQNDISNPLGTSVDGTYKSFLHVWNFGLTYKWDGLQPTPKEAEDWEGSTVAAK